MRASARLFPMPISIQVSGLKELHRALKERGERVRGSSGQAVMVKAARRIRDAEKAVAPVGDHPTFTNRKGVKWEPGMLRKSIVALKAKASKTQGPAAWVRINVRKKSVNAPQAVFVTGGVKAQSREGGAFVALADMVKAGLRKSAGKLRVAASGYAFFKHKKAQAPNPFFADTLQSSAPAALEQAAQDFKALIEK